MLRHVFQELQAELEARRRPHLDFPVIPEIILPAPVEDEVLPTLRLAQGEAAEDVTVVDLPPPVDSDSDIDGPASSIPTANAAALVMEQELLIEQEMLMLPDCRCKLQCIKHMVQDKQLTLLRAKVAKDDQMFFAFVKESMRCGDPTQTGSGVDQARSRPRLMLFGRHVCRRAFTTAIGVGPQRLDRAIKAVQQGHLDPLVDMRTFNGGSHHHEVKALTADAFFTFLYQSMAEPLAEEERVVSEVQIKGAALQLSDWVLANRGNPAAVASGGVLDRRMLPHMNMQEMYNLFWGIPRARTLARRIAL